ncbi:uncharacterized protein LOC134842702 isoform X3 [Symsagittifera roscoffensis]|uniref:uncharacterized protein LOC134842702 isoform X3 n=1 Tax=Symsagittifera roscoffensis TaxID=84072 RepID=UPI00307BD6E7
MGNKKKKRRNTLTSFSAKNEYSNHQHPISKYSPKSILRRSSANRSNSLTRKSSLTPLALWKGRGTSAKLQNHSDTDSDENDLKPRDFSWTPLAPTPPSGAPTSILPSTPRASSSNEENGDDQSSLGTIRRNSSASSGKRSGSNQSGALFSLLPRLSLREIKTVVDNVNSQSTMTSSPITVSPVASKSEVTTGSAVGEDRCLDNLSRGQGDDTYRETSLLALDAPIAAAEEDLSISLDISVPMGTGSSSEATLVGAGRVNEEVDDSAEDTDNAPSLSADDDGDRALVMSDCNNTDEDDKTEPPLGSSDDEGTLGPNSSQGSIESLKDDDIQSIASTNVAANFLSPVKFGPICDANHSRGSGDRVIKEVNRYKQEDNSVSSNSEASLSESSCAISDNETDSEKGATTDNYVTAAEDKDGYTTSASRRTNPFFSANEAQFHSALSSAGEDDSDNSGAYGAEDGRRVTITKERMNNLLLDKIERAQSSQKKGSGVDAAADDRSSNNSSKYTSPLPLIRLREGAAATSEEALVIRRPTSTISTSSAEYHTPGYYSSGDESARFLAGGDDSEFSEIDDFAFGPNMAAALLSNNSNSYLKNNSNQPPESQQNAHQPTLTRTRGNNVQFQMKKSQPKTYLSSSQQQQQQTKVNKPNESFKKSCLSSTSGGRHKDPTDLGTDRIPSGVMPSAGETQGPIFDHTKAIEEATRWLTQTNQFIVENSPSSAAAVAQFNNSQSLTINTTATSPMATHEFDPFASESAPVTTEVKMGVESEMKNPFSDAFATDSSPNLVSSTKNPFAANPTEIKSATDDLFASLENSANPLILPSHDVTTASDGQKTTSDLNGISDKLLMITEPNDPLLQSDPLMDSAAPLVFSQTNVNKQSITSGQSAASNVTAVHLSNNPFVNNSQSPVAAATISLPAPVITDPTCSEDFPEQWSFMLRFPTEKQLGKSRRWMNVEIKFDRENSLLKIFDKTRGTEISWEEILVSNRLFIHKISRQKYDDKGKVHTLKLVETNYRRRNQFDKIVATTIFQQPLQSRYIAEHRVRAKLGTTDFKVLDLFVKLFDQYQFQNHTVKHLQQGCYWSHPEIHMELVDICTGFIDTKGDVTEESISTSLFCLSFFVKSPEVTIGINDERVKGVEVVRRSDILPMKTDAWIKFDDVQFHHSVDKKLYLDQSTIVFQPLDACKYKLAEFKVRQHFYKDIPMRPLITCEQKGGVFKLEAELFLPSIQKIDFKFDAEMRRCENIVLVVPVPEQWIGLLRYDRPLLGEGSVKAAKRRTGYVSKTKVHGVKIQVTAGVAKYEHSYKAIVWRINRLPGKTSVSICSYKLFVQLISPGGALSLVKFDSGAEAELSYSMGWSVASGAVLRSMAVTNLPVEPLRAVENKANFHYTVQILHKSDDNNTAEQNTEKNNSRLQNETEA